MIKLILLWGLALLLAASGLAALLRGSFTFGTLAVWLFAFALAGYAIFNKPIDAFCLNGFGRVLKYTVWAGLTLFAALFVFVAVSGYTNTATGTESVIIVLGAGIKNETISDVLRHRLDAATKAWKSNPSALLVVAGGKGRQENISEALAMQRYLVLQGIPPSQIIMEDQSTSTEENLLFTKQILAQKGYAEDTEVALVTNAFHCYRAGKYAQKAGFTNVHTIPAGINFLSVLPSYIREEFAIVAYWLFRQ
ncbi:YdcF family protein [Ruminococcaceae bacterium OttesenSCG-928-A16]|nr:YdcF family protein [Ruminococcaceae bacterium OttesenSCG-928-A16]